MKYTFLLLTFAMMLSCSSDKVRDSNRTPKSGNTSDNDNKSGDSSPDLKDETDEHKHDDDQDSSNNLKYSLVAELVNDKCGICHSPDGDRSFSDLTSFEGLKKYAEASGKKVENGHKQSSTKLTESEKKLLIQLKTATLVNDLEENNSDDAAGEIVDNSNIIEFRIKAGTGDGEWNSSSESLKLKVGQTLRVYNDDSEVHALHTNGVPCDHGDDIKPGKYWNCELKTEFKGGSLYDHHNQQTGRFYFSVSP